MSTFASDTSKRSFKNWIIALSILLLGLIHCPFRDFFIFII